MTKKTITKETLKKAARTCLQTALGYIITNIVFVDFTGDKDVIKSALIGLCVSALSAGIAAVMNLEEIEEITETEWDYDPYNIEDEEEILESEVE